MRTQLRSITASAALVAVVSVGFAGCGSSKSTKASGSTTTAAQGAATTVAASPGAVTIKGFAFNPTPVTVKVGQKVTWTNQDAFAHTASSTSGPVKFDSGHIKSGATYSVTFTKPGRYQYICNIHNYMNGVIVVTG